MPSGPAWVLVGLVGGVAPAAKLAGRARHWEKAARCPRAKGSRPPLWQQQIFHWAVHVGPAVYCPGRDGLATRVRRGSVPGGDPSVAVTSNRGSERYAAA